MRQKLDGSNQAGRLKTPSTSRKEMMRYHKYPSRQPSQPPQPTLPISTLLHAAELEAEASGTPHAMFRDQLTKATKLARPVDTSNGAGAVKGDGDLRKIMMSNKKAKLYEKMQYGNRQRAEEVSARVLFFQLG